MRSLRPLTLVPTWLLVMRLLALTLTVVLGGCSKSPPYAGLPKSEAQFCEAIDRGRGEYDKADDAPNDLAKDKVRTAARVARKQALETALADGTFLGWIAQVENVAAGSTIDVDVRLPCKTKTLLKHDVTATEQHEEFLSALKVGSWILVTGTLSAGNSSDGFMEFSVTERGSMEAPEFKAAFVLMKPVAGPDDRYPDDVQPKLVAAVAEYRAKLKEEEKRAREEAERAARAAAPIHVCEAAQREITERFKTEVDFPSCTWNFNRFTFSVLSSNRYRIEGPFTYVNAFGAKMKARFRAEVEQGPEEDPAHPLKGFKVIHAEMRE